jgi:hypothetical protein
MPGGRSDTAADNVSSWVNDTSYAAELLDLTASPRALFPGQNLEEPPSRNDTVDFVHWLL